MKYCSRVNESVFIYVIIIKRLNDHEQYLQVNFYLRGLTVLKLFLSKKNKKNNDHYNPFKLFFLPDRNVTRPFILA